MQGLLTCEALDLVLTFLQRGLDIQSRRDLINEALAGIVRSVNRQDRDVVVAGSLAPRSGAAKRSLRLVLGDPHAVALPIVPVVRLAAEQGDQGLLENVYRRDTTNKSELGSGRLARAGERARVLPD